MVQSVDGVGKQSRAGVAPDSLNALATQRRQSIFVFWVCLWPVPGRTERSRLGPRKPES